MLLQKNGKPSKNIFIIAIIVVALFVGAYFAINGQSFSRGAGGVVVAQINGEPVYSSEAQVQMLQMLKGGQQAGFEKLDRKSKYFVVRELAAQKIILEAAKKEGFANSKTVVEKVDAFRNGVMRDEFLATLAKEAVTDEVVEERYNKDVEALKGRTQYRAKHIVVKSKAAADKIKKALKNKPFEALARANSIDGKTAKKGGDLGYLISGGMIPEFEDVVAAMKDGQVSSPIKTQYGWHLIKLVDKKDATPAPYDEVKDLLAKALYQEEIKNYVRDVVESAEIEIVENEVEEVAETVADEAESEAEVVQ